MALRSMYEYSQLSDNSLVRKEELVVHPVHIFDLAREDDRNLTPSFKHPENRALSHSPPQGFSEMVAEVGHERERCSVHHGSSILTL